MFWLRHQKQSGKHKGSSSKSAVAESKKEYTTFLRQCWVIAQYSSQDNVPSGNVLILIWHLTWLCLCQSKAYCKSLKGVDAENRQTNIKRITFSKQLGVKATLSQNLTLNSSLIPFLPTKSDCFAPGRNNYAMNRWGKEVTFEEQNGVAVNVSRPQPKRSATRDRSRYVSQYVVKPSMSYAFNTGTKTEKILL